jgi:hypothetical protein
MSISRRSFFRLAAVAAGYLLGRQIYASSPDASKITVPAGWGKSGGDWPFNTGGTISFEDCVANGCKLRKLVLNYYQPVILQEGYYYCGPVQGLVVMFGDFDQLKKFQKTIYPITAKLDVEVDGVLRTWGGRTVTSPVGYGEQTMSWTFRIDYFNGADIDGGDPVLAGWYRSLPQLDPELKGQHETPRVFQSHPSFSGLIVRE